MSLSNTTFALFAEVEVPVATSNTDSAAQASTASTGADTAVQTNAVPTVTGDAGETPALLSTSTEVPSGPLPGESSPAPVKNEMFSWVIMIVAFFCIMWFFMIRPQQSQQKKFNKMIDDLKPGDKVVTIGGINASVTQIIREKNMIQLLIDDKNNVKVMFDTRAIAYVVTPEEAEK